MMSLPQPAAGSSGVLAVYTNGRATDRQRPSSDDKAEESEDGAEGGDPVTA
ncbi:hypothetical protein Pph01_63420 [Planotetraspora phitsanulokensis]|uniref:Uncharacterized protein n=1 Tax=Planotetraspora phitsanulokensis TaxID=575192 RepID=A0A8J3UFE0_9ACTN|nr:hypothetical protein Pph01_63420 [Planotetraspora phitsanulokensis]